MIKIRNSTQRGFADHGWLKSYHSFSFADYYDPAHIHFRSLRVINEDWIAAGQGFGMHPHRDMEIITYVIAGQVEHQDSMGNRTIVLPDEIQRMSAGTGVMHSECNPSQTEELHLLQIWIMPKNKSQTSSYDQKKINLNDRPDQLCLIATGDEEEYQSSKQQSVFVDQDMKLFAARMTQNKSLSYSSTKHSFTWIQVVKGLVKVECQNKEYILNNGDALSAEHEDLFSISGQGEFLLFALK